MTQILTEAELALLLATRRIVLCTIADNGSPRPVPVCFAPREFSLGDSGPGESAAGVLVLYCPLDEKPKLVSDPHRLARVRDIEARPSVTLLADIWDEDWTRLAWLRLYGAATILEAPAARTRPARGDAAPNAESNEHEAAVSALRQRYPQYRSHDLASRPMIRVSVTRAVSWGSLPDPAVTSNRMIVK